MYKGPQIQYYSKNLEVKHPQRLSCTDWNSSFPHMISLCDFFAGFALCSFKSVAEFGLRKQKLAEGAFLISAAKEHLHLTNVCEQTSLTLRVIL